MSTNNDFIITLSDPKVIVWRNVTSLGHLGLIGSRDGSPLSLRGSMVELPSMESEGVSFDPLFINNVVLSKEGTLLGDQITI